MTIIVMLITLSGSYGFVGAAPTIAGFQTLPACEKAIPQVKAFYGSVEKVQCLSLSRD